MAVITTNAPSSNRSLSLEVWEVERDISNNRTKFGWRLYGSGGTTTSWVQSGNFYASIGGNQVYSSATRISLYNGTTVASGEIWLGHNSDGSKYVDMYCQAGIYAVAVNATASGGFWATSIPRQANLTGANDFSDEGNGYMTYSNPAGTAVSQLVGGLYWNGSEVLAGYRDVGMSASSYTFSLSESERNGIRSRLASSNSASVIYYLRTLIGGNYYYSTITRTVTIINATPSLTGFSFQDTNATTKALTGSDQILVKGKSNLRVYNITASTLKYSSKKSVIVDGSSATWSDTYEKTINGYTKNNVGVAIVDSRNLTSATLSKSFTLKEYFDITKISGVAVRGDNGVGEGTTITCKGTFWNDNFGAVANTITGTYRYKKTGTSTWITGTTAITITKSTNNFTINQIIKGDTATGFDIQNSYDIEVIVTDKLGTQTFSIILNSGSPAIAIMGNKISLGSQLDESSSAQVQVKGKPILEYTITKTW